MKDLLHLLQAEHRRSHGRKRWPIPSRSVEDIPLYHFHRHFHDCACGGIHSFEDLEQLLPPAYRALGWQIHLNLRRLGRSCADRNDRQTLYRTSLAARQVLQHFPPGEDLPTTLKELVHSPAALKALRAHHRSCSRGSKSPERRKELERVYLAQYSRHLERLVSHLPPSPRRRVPGGDRVINQAWLEQLTWLAEEDEFVDMAGSRGCANQHRLARR